jgi:hypothetical protein
VSQNLSPEASAAGEDFSGGTGRGNGFVALVVYEWNGILFCFGLNAWESSYTGLNQFFKK